MTLVAFPTTCGVRLSDLSPPLSDHQRLFTYTSLCCRCCLSHTVVLSTHTHIGTERRSVPNKYTPVIIPTPRRDEQSTRAYLSTSFSPYPSSSTPSQIAATQTEAFQLPTTAFPVRHQSSPPGQCVSQASGCCGPLLQ